MRPFLGVQKVCVVWLEFFDDKECAAVDMGRLI